MRLINQPIGLKTTKITPVDGPKVIGAASTTSLGAFNQTVSTFGFLWAFDIEFPPMGKPLARAVRGWLMANHSGANATRFKLIDPDQLQPKELGYNFEIGDQVPFSNGENFSNNAGFTSSYPVVSVANVAPKSATIITLPDVEWGHKLTVGTQFGFFPFHFGFYMVTEVRGNGEYRIFPPLQKALSTNDYATLQPTIVVRLTGPSAASIPRDVDFVRGASASFIQVFDADVREYFDDG